MKMKYILFVQNSSEGVTLLTDNIGEIQVFTLPRDKVCIEWKPILELFDRINFDPEDLGDTNCASWGCCDPRWDTNDVYTFYSRRSLNRFLNKDKNRAEKYRVEWTYHSNSNTWTNKQFNRETVHDFEFMDEEKLLNSLFRLQIEHIREDYVYESFRPTFPKEYQQPSYVEHYNFNQPLNKEKEDDNKQ